MSRCSEIDSCEMCDDLADLLDRQTRKSKSLQSERDQLKMQNKTQKELLRKANNANADLRREVEVLEKAVSFYGDKASWKICEQYKPWRNHAVIKDDADMKTVDESKREIFAGKTARECLKQLEEMRGSYGK